MQVCEDIPLAPLTTFGIGGPARWFAEVGSEADLVEALGWADERQIPVFVLGGGSNLLVSDAGFNGLVLHIVLKGIEQQGALFRVAAGEPWDDFVALAVERGFAGVECLAGIPGSVGGTPVQNVGAYGQEVADTIERVRAYDRESRAFVEIAAADCGFAYRRSCFNTVDRGRYVVTRVDFRLQAGGAPQLNYVDLKARFSGCSAPPALAEVAAVVRDLRQSKGMLMVDDDTDCHSAGSFFKNPTVEPVVAELVRGFAETRGVVLRTFPTVDGREKIPAAWLIEQAGFQKGFALGAAAINARHTLALCNRGGATAADVLKLAQLIQTKVEKQFGIRLEMEPVRVGFEADR
jgi:UDP-N-acetylmuramate dehydrogenase